MLHRPIFSERSWSSLLQKCVLELAFSFSLRLFFQQKIYHLVSDFGVTDNLTGVWTARYDIIPARIYRYPTKLM